MPIVSMNNIYKLIKLHLLILLLICSTPVLADSFRCHNKVVLVGYSTFEVKDKCGIPSEEEEIGYVKVKNEYLNVKRYVYNLGKGKFLKILVFHNGKLVEIIDGPRA